MSIKRKSGRTVKPPDDLSETMKQFWRKVVAGWELEANHLRLLEIACRAWDRALEASSTATKEGPFFTDKNGIIRPHPGLAAELSNRKLFIASLRELGLDVRVPDNPRGPSLPHYMPRYETRSED
jgi:phage terminase small subunit